MEARRRRAALYFLSNISLDGQLVVNDGDAQAERPYCANLSFMDPDLALGVSRAPSSMTASGNSNTEEQLESVPATSLYSPEASAEALWSASHFPEILKETSQSTCMEIKPSRNFTVETQRCPTGSPRSITCKKVHFIKNMRQHDTRNGRIVLMSVRRSLYSIFSVVPYEEFGQFGDLRSDRGRQRHSQSGMGMREGVIGIEGVELGAKGKTVSYTELLYPTNALCSYQSDLVFSTHSPRLHQSQEVSTQSSIDKGTGTQHFVQYDPNLLEDPQWPCGKHKRVLVFCSYMITVIEYVKPSYLKRDMNETFSEKFPHVQLTLSKIRSLKREIRKLAQEECGYEEPTVAMAFVYFEKLALQGKIDKQNRKLCAGACILLAAKIGSDLKRPDVKNLIDKLEERFRLNRKDLLAFEFPVLVALEFKLHLPHDELLPHYRRLLLKSYNQNNQ